MNIDLTRFKPFWYELDDGTEVESVPSNYEGNVTYWTAFPCQFTEHVDSYVYHPKKWYEKLLLKINPKLQSKWNATRPRTYRRAFEFNTTYTGMSDVIVSMVNSGDYTLEQAIWICAKSCERCMNVLSDKYCGYGGYPEFSDEWAKCGTSCLFCAELGYGIKQSIKDIPNY